MVDIPQKLNDLLATFHKHRNKIIQNTTPRYQYCANEQKKSKFDVENPIITSVPTEPTSPEGVDQRQ
jgi:hypothetical protein